MHPGPSIPLSILLLSAAFATAEPPVDAPTFAELRVVELDRWSDELTLPGASEGSELVYDATQVLTQIATGLLVRGDRGGASSSGATMAGAALADGLDVIRRQLELVDDPSIPEANRASARSSLRRFLGEARRRLATLAIPNPDRLDVQLAELLEPLVEAIRHLTGSTVPGGWWNEVGPDEPDDPWSRLRARFDAVEWLNTAARNRVLERVDAVAGDPAQAEAVGALVLVVDAIDALHGQPEGRSRAVVLGRRFEDLVLFRERGLPAGPALIEVARVVDRMARDRTIRTPESLPRNVRRLHATIRRSYDRAERDMVEQLPALVASAAPRTDPSLVAAIRAHSSPLERMLLLGDSAGWSDAVRTIDPGAGPLLDRRLGVLRRALGVEASESDVSAAMDSIRTIGDALSLLRPLANEEALTDADPERDRLLAGTARALSDDLDRLRRALVREIVADPPARDAVSALRLRRRLLDRVDRFRAVTAHDDAWSGIEGWSGWYVDPELVERVEDRIATRLRIAATALQQDEPGVARRQLDRVDRDLSLGELLARLVAARPDRTPDGTSGAVLVGRLAVPPGPEAWMVEHRDSMARLARFLLESDAALADGRIEDAEWFEDRAAAIVRDLTTRLDAR